MLIAAIRVRRKESRVPRGRMLVIGRLGALFEEGWDFGSVVCKLADARKNANYIR